MNIFYFPAQYYLESRYKKKYKAVLYLLKYHGFFAGYLWLVSQYSALMIFSTAAIFLLFYNVYDFFCFQNDQGEPSISYGVDLPVHRQTKVVVVKKGFIYLKLIYFVIILSTLIYLDLSIAIASLILIGSLSVIFLTHNSVANTYKGFTLFGLYMTKAFIFLIPFLGTLSSESLKLCVIIFSIFNFSYVPKYVFRKIYFFKKIAPELYKKSFMKPIILKNIMLIPLILVDVKVLYLLVYINILTMLEYVLDKRLSSNSL